MRALHAPRLDSPLPPGIISPSFGYMDVKRSVSVEIAGQRFTLRTDADEAYVKSLARFVSERMEELRKGSRTVATQSLALLAAMNIADDLFQERRAHAELKQRVREKSRSILELIHKEAKL